MMKEGEAPISPRSPTGTNLPMIIVHLSHTNLTLLSGVPDYFDRNKISSGGDLSHYSSASLY